VAAVAVGVTAVAAARGDACTATARRSSSRRCIAVLNAFVPPILAALRLPFTLLLGFVLVLLADAGILPARPTPSSRCDPRRRLRRRAARGARHVRR
jgi:hypothetical protein